MLQVSHMLNSLAELAVNKNWGGREEETETPTEKIEYV